MSLPQNYLSCMQTLLGSDYPDFLASYNKERVNGLRVNTLKLSVSEFENRTHFGIHPVPWAPDGFYYDYTTFPGQHPYFAAGLYYLQEPSAMAVVTYLDPQPGEWVLDLAAAPGGKSTQIASLLKHQGLLWANEIHPARARILAANLEHWGTANVIVSNESPNRLSERLGCVFDRILLDAPCSGEGMFRKEPSARSEWSVENVSSCALRQRNILDSAAPLLKPGGRLVYSTCTFNLDENEKVLLSFLENHPDFSPLKLPLPYPHFTESTLLPGAVRLYPHLLQGEGHFIAVLEKSKKAFETRPLTSHINSQIKTNSSPGKPFTKRSKKSANPLLKADRNPNDSLRPLELVVEEFKTFTESIAYTPLKLASLYPTLEPISSYTLFGSHLYLNPAPELSLTGIKIISPGLHLGEKKTGRFQPGSAFALSLTSESIPNYLALAPESPELRMYLQGESFVSPGLDGWVLVGVEEFPLGWAKRVQGQLKNHYPKEWRFTPKIIKP